MEASPCAMEKTKSRRTRHLHDEPTINTILARDKEFGWLSRADRDGTLGAFLNPDLTPPERTLVQVEGWILGVPGLIRSGQGRDDSNASASCMATSFRLH
jgi:hypothetical protein